MSNTPKVECQSIFQTILAGLNWQPKPQLFGTKQTQASMNTPAATPLLTPAKKSNPAWRKKDVMDLLKADCVPSAFYDRHLADEKQLKRVRILDGLLPTLSNTFDEVLYRNKRKLPPSLHFDKETVKKVNDGHRFSTGSVDEIRKHYFHYATRFGLPIASTLGFSRLAPNWTSLFKIKELNRGYLWALSHDHHASISLLYADPENEPEKARDLTSSWNAVDLKARGLLKEISEKHVRMGLWQFRSLREGREGVMNDILELAREESFRWDVCDSKMTTPQAVFHGCRDRSHFIYKDARVHPLNVISNKLKKSRSARPRPPKMNIQRSLKPFAQHHQEVYTGKRKSRDNDEEHRSHSCQRRKLSTSETVVKDLPEHDYIQKCWGEAVRLDSTYIVFHSGITQLIGFRHRKSGTLYLSHLIDLSGEGKTSDEFQIEKYGKIQVGLYLTTIRDAIDRMEQTLEAADKPQPDVNIISNGTRSRRHFLNAATLFSEITLTPPRHSEKFYTHDALSMHFCYGIYNSPRPATFGRLHGGFAFSRIRPPALDTYPMEPFIKIVIKDEAYRGSTGMVHFGTMHLDDDSFSGLKVAVKLAFSDNDKQLLIKERDLYERLGRNGQHRGIPTVYGLFVDSEPIGDAQGPLALVMSYSGSSLYSILRHPEDLPEDEEQRKMEEEKEMEMMDNYYDQCLSILNGMHEAGVVHRDIRLPNICVDENDKVTIIDMSHARARPSSKDRDVDKVRYKERSKIFKEGMVNDLVKLREIFNKEAPPSLKIKIPALCLRNVCQRSPTPAAQEAPLRRSPRLASKERQDPRLQEIGKNHRQQLKTKAAKSALTRNPVARKPRKRC